MPKEPQDHSGLTTKKTMRPAFSFNSYLRQRELGKKLELGFNDSFSKGIYSALMPSATRDYQDDLHSSEHGGVFNLEFSPDGSLLVAACEKKSILMFDPLNRKRLECISEAHEDCVNCVRFLDSRVFATCSDDSTVALWDARNLKSRIRTLQGHSNWVKNIEFSHREGLLVTSGFDGSIYTWDINSYTEQGFVYNRVFRTNGLMRTRLTPDASKMIICTTGGYLIIIHDLDLKTLDQDLAGFKPNMYRLMQLSHTAIPVAASFTHLFSHSRTRNRVEFVVDFPVGDEAEVVSSLQVHPQGWCVLSRNISNDENSEWTCVHDIQDTEEVESEDEESEYEFFEAMGEIRYDDGPVASNSVPDGWLPAPEAGPSRLQDWVNRHQPPGGVGPSGIELQLTTADVWEAMLAVQDARNRGLVRQNGEGAVAGGSSDQAGASSQNSRDQGTSRAAGSSRADTAGSSRANPAGSSGANPAGSSGANAAGSSGANAAAAAHGNPANPNAGVAWQGQVARSLRNAGRLWRNLGNGTPRSIEDEQRRLFLQMSSFSLAARTVQLLRDTHTSNGQTYNVPPDHRIHRNRFRLTHFVEEPNVGRGFIKELCFSPDGRIICSPYGSGVRLLSFNSECSELPQCVPEVPAMLYEQRTNVCRGDIVLSTQFSPVHCLLVSGCLGGNIVWHQPQP